MKRMMRLKKLLIGALLIAVCAGIVGYMPAGQTYAAPISVGGGACGPATETSPACQAPTTDPISGSGGILGKVTHLVAILTGIAAIIMFIIGGLMYVLSNGDSSRVTLARNTLIYASIGVVITIAAQSIVVFVLNKT